MPQAIHLDGRTTSITTADAPDLGVRLLVPSPPTAQKIPDAQLRIRDFPAYI